jgi:ketosteroid isomerase-like protein
MSRQNVEVVRTVVDAVNDRDIACLLELTNPDVEWHTFLAELRVEGAYRGHDGIRQWLRDVEDAWEFLRVEIDDTLATGALVLMVGRLRYRGKGSGVELETPTGWVAKFRQGKLAYGRLFREPEITLGSVGLEALDAPGLAEAGCSDAEILRQYFVEVNRAFAGEGDLYELATRYVHPDAVAELGVMEGKVVGPEGHARYFEGQLAVIEEMRIDPEEFIEIGGRIVMPFRLHGRARETGLPIEFRYAQLIEMRSGKFFRTRMCAIKERALAAARLHG